MTFTQDRSFIRLSRELKLAQSQPRGEMTHNRDSKRSFLLPCMSTNEIDYEWPGRYFRGKRPLYYSRLWTNLGRLPGSLLYHSIAVNKREFTVSYSG